MENLGFDEDQTRAKKKKKTVKITLKLIRWTQAQLQFNDNVAVCPLAIQISNTVNDISLLCLRLALQLQAAIHFYNF